MVADLRKLSLGQRDYYTQEIALDREEYLSGTGRRRASGSVVVPSSSAWSAW